MGEDRLSSLNADKFHRLLAAVLLLDNLIYNFVRRYPQQMLLSCMLND